MTKQEVFDIVWQKYVVEQAPACFVTNDDGNRISGYFIGENCCAIGWLVPEELRDKVAGNAAIQEYLDEGEEVYHHFGPELYDSGILTHLQECHDKAVDEDVSDLADWFRNMDREISDETIDCVRNMSFHDHVQWRLRRVAEAYDLRIPTS